VLYLHIVLHGGGMSLHMLAGLMQSLSAGCMAAVADLALSSCQHRLLTRCVLYPRDTGAAPHLLLVPRASLRLHGDLSLAASDCAIDIVTWSLTAGSRCNTLSMGRSSRSTL
jgi:hypothetical protein